MALLAVLGTSVSAATSGPPSWEVQLAPPGEPGVPFVLEGRVTGAEARPLRDVLVHVYHADDRGNYSRRGESRPRLSGVLRTNVLGAFRIRTVLPGLAEGVPHVHFELKGPGPEYRAITLNLARAQGAGSDTTYARLPQMLSFPSTGYWTYVRLDEHGVFRATWDIPFYGAHVLERPPEAFAHPR